MATYTYVRQEWHVNIRTLYDWLVRLIRAPDGVTVGTETVITYNTALTTDEVTTMATFLNGSKPNEYVYRRYVPSSSVLKSEITTAVGKTPIYATPDEVRFQGQLTTAEKQALLNYVKSDLKKFEEVIM